MIKVVEQVSETKRRTWSFQPRWRWDRTVPVIELANCILQERSTGRKWRNAGIWCANGLIKSSVERPDIPAHVAAEAKEKLVKQIVVVHLGEVA